MHQVYAEVFLIKKQLGFSAFSSEPAALPSKTQILGKHGPWHYHGEQWGWLKDGLSLELHKEVVSAQLWAVCLKPPLITESCAEFHQRRWLESQTTRVEKRECVSMGGEDALIGKVKPAPRPHRQVLCQCTSHTFTHDET